MQKDYTANELMEWVHNYKNNDGVPAITSSALITLEELEQFIATAKRQNADSVRIHFVRFRADKLPTPKLLGLDGKEKEGCKWWLTANGFTQTSIAMVPAKNFRHDADYIFSAEDIVVDNKVSVLTPGIAKKGTAMNPPGKS